MGLKVRAGSLAIGWLFIANAALAAERQLIQTGWDSPTAAEFRSGIAEFEKWKVFDGAAVVPTRRVGERALICSAAFSTNHWEWSEFADCVRDLEAARPAQCTNNYLMLLANPGNVGWFDDAGWDEVVDHWRLLARVARQGRMAGLIFDAEPYSKPWSQFLYAAQPDKDRHSFAEMSGKARERGRAVMSALAEEYPNIKLLAYRLFSDLPRSGDPKEPVINLESSAYGFMPAFVDGWFDALPPGISIVEGNESAYGYENVDEYYLAFTRLKLQSLDLVSQSNRSKVRQQFSVGHGIYLDGYSPAAGGKLLVDLTGETAAHRLMRFTATALDAADGPVWIYGESGRWWPKATNRVEWPQKFPAVVEALMAAKDPRAFAFDYLRDAKPEMNLLRPSAWQPWQAEGSKGKSAQKETVTRFVGMENGASSQMISVKPGETYAVGARVRRAGGGDVGIAVAWKNGSRWVATRKRLEFVASGPRGTDGFRDIAGLVQAPADASSLVFLFFARRQSEGDEAEFKDAILVRVAD